MKPTQLQVLRDTIDVLDTQLVDILQKRFQLSKEIGDKKNEMGLPIIDKDRETQIVKRLSCLGVDSNLIQEIYSVIFKYSQKCQK